MGIWTQLKRISLTQWIIIAMILGVIIGAVAPNVGIALKPLSTIFLRMIKSIIVPIIFGTLVVESPGMATT
jgi:proton glutamate symport protein